MIRKMLFKQHYAIQLTRDVRHAVNGSLISQPRGLALVALIQIARERERLRRYSMSASSWKLWFGSARKLILLQPSFRTVPIGDGAVVVVQPQLVANLTENPQAQLNLLHFCRLAREPEPPRLPNLNPQP